LLCPQQQPCISRMRAGPLTLDGLDLEETYELVKWIQQDMDTVYASAHKASPFKEVLIDQDGCDMAEVSSPRKVSASLEQLLC